MVLRSRAINTWTRLPAEIKENEPPGKLKCKPDLFSKAVYKCHFPKQIRELHVNNQFTWVSIFRFALYRPSVW